MEREFYYIVVEEDGTPHFVGGKTGRTDSFESVLPFDSRLEAEAFARKLDLPSGIYRILPFSGER